MGGRTDVQTVKAVLDRLHDYEAGWMTPQEPDDLYGMGIQALDRLEARLDEAEQSLQATRAALSGTQHVRDKYKARLVAVEDALRAVHPYVCGCDEPGSEAKCVFYEWEPLRAALAAADAGQGTA